MIWCDNRFWPIAGRSAADYNTLFVSPWSGQVWARIDRQAAEWFPQRASAAGERPWPLPESIPGSLFLDYDLNRWGVDRELPRILLRREIALLEQWTSAAASWYNESIPDMELNVNPSLMQEIATLRAKEAAGTLSDEELRAALRKMREGRVTAAKTSAAARARKTPVDPDKALEDFLS